MGMGGEMGEAAQEINKEMSDLEKCKKELAAAKARLKTLMDEKAKRERIAQAARDAKTNVTFNTSALEGREETLEERLEREMRENQEAISHYEQQLKDVEQTKKDIIEAKKALEKARAAPKNPRFVNGKLVAPNAPA